jgi:carbon monoxide dehydrogenase subunit G
MRGHPGGHRAVMGDYERSTTVDVPVDDLFEFLSRVENLPRYMDRMTEAHSLAGDEVSVEAKVEPGDVGSEGAENGERTVRGEAWFRIDADQRTVAWGSEGPHDYRGELEVTPAGPGSTVTVRLHTMHEADGIEDGIDETLANIQRIAGTDPEVDPGTATT